MGGEDTTIGDTGPRRSGLGRTAVVLLVGLVASVGYIGYRLGTTQIASMVGDEVPVDVDPEYLDFGNAWWQDEFPWTMPS